MYSMRMGATALANHVHLNAISYTSFLRTYWFNQYRNSGSGCNCQIRRNKTNSFRKVGSILKGKHQLRNNVLQTTALYRNLRTAVKHFIRFFSL
jgi:hypothetical protein